jgi:hypothetical protein
MILHMLYARPHISNPLRPTNSDNRIEANQFLA